MGYHAGTNVKGNIFIIYNLYDPPFWYCSHFSRAMSFEIIDF